MQKLPNIFSIFLFGILWTAPSFASEQVTEKVVFYPISGDTAVALYRSIGEKGPLISDNIRTIAHTNFTLTWQRKYKKDDGNCTLVLAKPRLIITYTLPKPSQKLPQPVAQSWQKFITGIERHEHMHGYFIKEMVRNIELETVGMSIKDDPKCIKFKAELDKKLSVLFQEQRQKGRDLDRADMKSGGIIHQLILNFLNGS